LLALFFFNVKLAENGLTTVPEDITCIVLMKLCLPGATHILQYDEKEWADSNNNTQSLPHKGLMKDKFY